MSAADSPTPAASAIESAAIARAVARLLASGRAVDLASTLTTIAVLLFAVVWAVASAVAANLVWPLVAILALGLAQKVYAVRARFDAGLFADLAEAWQQRGASDVDAPLRRLDQALAALGLRPAPAAPLRPLLARAAGAKRLLFKQALCLGLQWLILAATSTMSG